MKLLQKRIGIFLGILLCCGILGLAGLILLPKEQAIDFAGKGTAEKPDETQLVSGYQAIQSSKAEIPESLSELVRSPQISLTGNNQDVVTIMVYINGSDLESEDGSASDDLKEMLSATLSDQINFVVQTGGTKEWHTRGISSETAQRFLIQNGELILLEDDLGQLDVTDPKTLSDFILSCSKQFPADRNILIMWNHGGGAVYGFGYDENVTDPYAALTLDEMRQALTDGGVYFDFIGFDACMMSSLEVCYALCDHADYLIASEDFESGEGWEYKNWLNELGQNSSIPTVALGSLIVDDYVSESKDADSSGILSLIDLGYSRLLYHTWTSFAYAEKDLLTATDYSAELHRSARAQARWFGHGDDAIQFSNGHYDSDNTEEDSISDYYAVDMMATASNLETEESQALASALSYALAYSNATSEDQNLTGLSVTLPYGDREFYYELLTVFSNCGFDSEYLDYLSAFTETGSNEYSDWDNWSWDSANNWDDAFEYYWDDFWSGIHDDFHFSWDADIYYNGYSKE